jgi:hypothetical protein
MPAQAGIHARLRNLDVDWIAAFAAMTCVVEVRTYPIYPTAGRNYSVAARGLR